MKIQLQYGIEIVRKRRKFWKSDCSDCDFLINNRRNIFLMPTILTFGSEVFAHVQRIKQNSDRSILR